MSILKSISERQAKGKVKKIFAEIKKKRNIKKIPNFWKTLANDPNTLERTWNSFNTSHAKRSLRSFNKRNDIYSCINDQQL